MFTGIIEDIGEVINFDGKKLSFLTKLENLKIGDSISVNGVCLTITNYRQQITNYSKFYKNNNIAKTEIIVEVSKETISRTNISLLKKGDFINLERALTPNSRIGGHFVSGHIDTTVKIRNIKKEIDTEKNLVMTIELPSKFAKYVVEKGSVAIDGVSLTVVEVKKDSFSVVLIPHTIESTILKYKKVSDIVNLEVDILAKYVEKTQNKKTFSNDEILLKKLKENGFMN